MLRVIPFKVPFLEKFYKKINYHKKYFQTTYVQRFMYICQIDYYLFFFQFKFFCIYEIFNYKTPTSDNKRNCISFFYIVAEKFILLIENYLQRLSSCQSIWIYKDYSGARCIEYLKSVDFVFAFQYSLRRQMVSFVDKARLL